MTSMIKHRGIVENVNGSQLQVRIRQTSACASCSAKGYCGSSESKEKLIDIYDSEHQYHQGEEVVVCGSTSMGMRAVLIAFVFPFILLLVTLFIAMAASGDNELLSGVVALLILIPYYIILYFFRNKIKKNFSFTIKPINN